MYVNKNIEENVTGDGWTWEVVMRARSVLRASSLRHDHVYDTSREDVTCRGSSPHKSYLSPHSHERHLSPHPQES